MSSAMRIPFCFFFCFLVVLFTIRFPGILQCLYTFYINPRANIFPLECHFFKHTNSCSIVSVRLEFGVYINRHNIYTIDCRFYFSFRFWKTDVLGICFFYFYYCLVEIFYRWLMRFVGNFLKRLILFFFF